MFNLGITEILALGTLALIVIGPKQLPEVAKTLARVLNELKNATGDLGKTFSEAKEETQQVFNDVVGDFNEYTDPEALLAKAIGEEDNVVPYDPNYNEDVNYDLASELTAEVEASQQMSFDEINEEESGDESDT